MSLNHPDLTSLSRFAAYLEPLWSALWARNFGESSFVRVPPVLTASSRSLLPLLLAGGGGGGNWPRGRQTQHFCEFVWRKARLNPLAADYVSGEAEGRRSWATRGYQLYCRCNGIYPIFPRFPLFHLPLTYMDMPCISNHLDIQGITCIYMVYTSSIYSVYTWYII